MYSPEAEARDTLDASNATPEAEVQSETKEQLPKAETPTVEEPPAQKLWNVPFKVWNFGYTRYIYWGKKGNEHDE